MTDATLYSAVYITDGLSISEAKKRFQERRNQLKQTLSIPCLITGVKEHLNRQEPWLLTHSPLYQEPVMSFFTGVNQTQTALLLNPFGEDILFVPKKDPKKEFWEGIQFGCGTPEAEEDITHLLGFSTCEDIDTLFSFMSTYISIHKLSTLGLFWYEPHLDTQKNINDTTFRFKEKLSHFFEKHSMSISLFNIAAHIWPMRLCLDSIDQNNIKVANEKTTSVFKTVCKAMSNLKEETEVAGCLTGELLKQSWLGYSFPPIIASGKNAAILHYHANNAPLMENSLLLLDFGLRHWHMPSDVSRTIPVSGTFTPMQQCLYQIVLDAQQAVEHHVKEGVTIQELNDICWTTLEKLLDERFHSIGGRSHRAYDYQPHNVSHLIGLMVHDGDPYRNYRSLPLKSGMVISNEPGLYGTFEATFNGIHYKETLGIRIEDNLLITSTGCLNLTCCPKTCDEIEALLR